jgi:hypothetical protein
MSDDARIDFSRLSWTQGAPGARSKAVERGTSRLRLVEFTPEFLEADWCAKAHRGVVLEGTLELVFPDRTETLHAGDGLFIQGGAAGRHKAFVRAGVARLILADEA